VDPVADPLLFRKFGSAGNRIRTSESVARNSDHYRGGRFEETAAAILGRVETLAYSRRS
jgi:hypothetical protein